MGAECSTASGKTKGIPGIAKKNIIARWQNRQHTHQMFAVARHDERADGLYAIFNGGRWTQTEDFKKWPTDPPLSDAGIEGARYTAQQVLSKAESCACQISIVISSPYYRCVQTAVEYCLALGPKTRLLIDRSLGEIYGPEIMGPTEPCYPVRPIEHTRMYCESKGVTCHSEVIGRWPSWPEEVKDARKRYASRFLTYLQRGSVTKRNFILVTHADCVATSASLMPSHSEHSVETVDYGGIFIATKKQQVAKICKPRTDNRLNAKKHAAVVPGADADSGTAMIVDDSSNADLVMSPELELGNGWPETITSEKHNGDGGLASSDGELDLRQASAGWQVCTINITMAKRVFTAGAFNKRVKTLAKSGCLGRERIEKLLGKLSNKPFGAEDLEVVQDPHQDERTGTHHSLPSTISFSTFLFGSSDVANISDCGSDAMSPRSHGCLEQVVRSPTQTSLLRRRSPRSLSRGSHLSHWSNSSLGSPHRSPTKKSLLHRRSQRSLSRGSHLSHWSNSSPGSPHRRSPKSMSFPCVSDEITTAGSKTLQSVLSPKQLKDISWESLCKQVNNEVWPYVTVDAGGELKFNAARAVNGAMRQRDVGTGKLRLADANRRVENSPRTLEIVDEKMESADSAVPRGIRSSTIPMCTVQPAEVLDKTSAVEANTKPSVVKSTEDASEVAAPVPDPVKMPDIGNSALLRRRSKNKTSNAP